MHCASSKQRKSRIRWRAKASEDSQDLADARAALAEFKASGAKAISIDDVRAVYHGPANR